MSAEMNEDLIYVNISTVVNIWQGCALCVKFIILHQYLYLLLTAVKTQDFSNRAVGFIYKSGK